MQKLNRQFGEMVQLATEDNGEVFYIEKIDSTHIIRIVSEIGSRLPMHCCGLGKAMLAYMSPSDVKLVLNRSGMPMMTRYTITDPDVMEMELAKIRAQGFAMDDQEIMEGLRCIAVPIFDANENVKYAISIAAIADRLVGDYFEKVKHSIVMAASEISHSLGYKKR